MVLQKKDVLFLAITLTTIVIAFFIHLTILNGFSKPLIYVLLSLSYVVNYGVYILSLAGYFIFTKKLKNWLGYYFMSIMTVKFILLLALFMPDIKEDGIITKKEFFMLFIPYAICLIFTAKHLINKLR